MARKKVRAKKRKMSESEHMEMMVKRTAKFVENQQELVFLNIVSAAIKEQNFVIDPERQMALLGHTIDTMSEIYRFLRSR